MSEGGRTAQVSIRMTPEQRDEFNARAKAAGQSAQEYAVSTLLGRPVKYRPGTPPKKRMHGQEQELPMTG